MVNDLTYKYQSENSNPKGRPALWEKGGACSSTVEEVRVVAGATGEPLIPLHVRTNGDLSNANHALVPTVVGGYIITVTGSRHSPSLSIEKITSISQSGEIEAELVLQAEHQLEEDETVLIDSLNLKAAVDAALWKADKYHCRRAVYILAPR